MGIYCKGCVSLVEEIAVIRAEAERLKQERDEAERLLKSASDKLHQSRSGLRRFRDERDLLQSALVDLLAAAGDVRWQDAPDELVPALGRAEDALERIQKGH